MTIEFACHHCCRPNRADDALAGRPTRCTHCGKLVVVASVATGSPVFVDEDAAPAAGDPALGFAVFSPVQAMQAERRRSNWQRTVARIRVVLIVGTVAGMTVGAALGRGWDAATDVLQGRAVGAFLGILFGTSLGAMYGLLQSIRPRLLAQGETIEMLSDLGGEDGVPNVFELVALVFGLARSQGKRRLDPGNFILLGVFGGALIGAVVGAELAQAGLEMSRPDWQPVLVTAVGGLGGFSLMLAIVYVVWRPWQRLKS